MCLVFAPHSLHYVTPSPVLKHLTPLPHPHSSLSLPLITSLLHTPLSLIPTLTPHSLSPPLHHSFTLLLPHSHPHSSLPLPPLHHSFTLTPLSLMPTLTPHSLSLLSTPNRSARLAYEDLTAAQKKAEQQMKDMNPQKKKQMERLGMGVGHVGYVT